MREKKVYNNLIMKIHPLTRNRYWSPYTIELMVRTGFQSSRKMLRHTFPSRSMLGWYTCRGTALVIWNSCYTTTIYKFISSSEMMNYYSFRVFHYYRFHVTLLPKISTKKFFLYQNNNYITFSPLMTKGWIYSISKKCEKNVQKSLKQGNKNDNTNRS